MGTGQKRNRLLVPEASKAMYQFKYEMAREVGVENQIKGIIGGIFPPVTAVLLVVLW